MIKQAIIPLAGLGTRLLPLTSVMPKELLPINGKPGLEYILDECIEAGIKEIIFVISSKKKIIKKYFYNDVFYKKIIKRKKDKRLKNEYSKTIVNKQKTEQHIGEKGWEKETVNNMYNPHLEKHQKETMYKILGSPAKFKIQNRA